MKYFFAICLAALSFTACQRRPHPPQMSEGQGVAVAKMGDQLITSKELEEVIRVIEDKFPRKYTTHPQKLALLQEILNVELLADAAIRQGFEKRYEFKTKLAEVYIEDLAARARKLVTEDELRSYYEKNKERYDQISARHILFKYKDKDTAESKRETRQRLEKIREEVLKNPDSFGEKAKAYSEDNSRTAGGELGYFTHEMMVTPFSQAAFKLAKVGDISPIVESQYGYHIIQLTGDRRGFEYAKENIRNELLRKTQRERLDKEIERLRSAKKIEIFEDNLAKLSPLPPEISTDPDKLIPKNFKVEPDIIASPSPSTKPSPKE